MDSSVNETNLASLSSPPCQHTGQLVQPLVGSSVFDPCPFGPATFSTAQPQLPPPSLMLLFLYPSPRRLPSLLQLRLSSLFPLRFPRRLGSSYGSSRSPPVRAALGDSDFERGSAGKNPLSNIMTIIVFPSSSSSWAGAGGRNEIGRSCAAGAGFRTRAGGARALPFGPVQPQLLTAVQMFEISETTTLGS